MRRVSWLLLLFCCVMPILARLLQTQKTKQRTNKAMFSYGDVKGKGIYDHLLLQGPRGVVYEVEDQGQGNRNEEHKRQDSANPQEQNNHGYGFKDWDNDKLEGKGDHETVFEGHTNDVDEKDEEVTVLDATNTGVNGTWNNRTTLDGQNSDVHETVTTETVFEGKNGDVDGKRYHTNSMDVQPKGAKGERDDRTVQSNDGNRVEDKDEGVKVKEGHGATYEDDDNAEGVDGCEDSGDVYGDRIHGDMYVDSARRECRETNSALECFKYIALDYLHRMAEELTKTTHIWGPISIIRTPPTTSVAEDTTIAELQPRASDSRIQQLYKFARRQLERYASTHALAWTLDDDAAVETEDAVSTGRGRRRKKGIHGKRTAQIALPLIALTLFKLKIIGAMMLMILMCMKQFMMFASVMMPLMSKINFGRSPGGLLDSLQAAQQTPAPPSHPNAPPEPGVFQGYPYSYMRSQQGPQQYRTILQGTDYPSSPYDSGQRAALRARP